MISVQVTNGLAKPITVATKMNLFGQIKNIKLKGHHMTGDRKATANIVTVSYCKYFFTPREEVKRVDGP